MERVHWVLPAYNEAASIGDMLSRIEEVSRDLGLDFDVTVIDDGSGDDTGDIARAAGERMPVAVFRNEPNRGLGYTIRRGLREALSVASDDDAVVTLDADLTQDPVYAGSMLSTLAEGADVVIASRYRPGAGMEGVSALRLLLSYGASALVSLARPIRGVRDYSCGFRAYRAAVLRLGFELFGDDFVSESGFGCMVEIAQRLRGRAVFAEVPFVLRYDAKRQASAIRIVPTIRSYFRVLGCVRRDERRLRRASRDG